MTFQLDLSLELIQAQAAESAIDQRFFRARWVNEAIVLRVVIRNVQ
jgi:hypothetical protein